MVALESIGWVGIRDADPTASVRFLEQAFGLTHVGEEGADPQVVLLPSGQTVKVFADGRGRRARDIPSVGFLVADLGSAVDQALAHGAVLVSQRKSNALGAEWQHLCTPSGQLIDLTHRPDTWMDRIRR